MKECRQNVGLKGVVKRVRKESQNVDRSCQGSCFGCQSKIIKSAITQRNNIQAFKSSLVLHKGQNHGTAS